MLKLTVLAASLTAAALVFAPSIARAEHHDGKLEAAFKKADKDNDGTLDKEEAKSMPRVAKNFDAIDTDKDGTVSLDEIQCGHEEHEEGHA